MAPLLLLLVPGHWEEVPDGMRELRRHLSDEYGARLDVRPARLNVAIPICCGWEDLAHPGADVGERVERAFFTLDWVDA